MKTVRIHRIDTSVQELGEMDYDAVAKLWDEDQWVLEATCGYDFGIADEQTPGFLEMTTEGAVLKIIAYTSGFEVWLVVRKAKRFLGFIPYDYELIRLTTFSDALSAVRLFYETPPKAMPDVFERWKNEIVDQEAAAAPSTTTIRRGIKSRFSD